MKYIEYRNAIKLIGSTGPRSEVRSHTLVAVASVLWDEQDPVMTVWGAGPSRRSARRAATRTLQTVGRNLDTEEIKYVNIPHGKRYATWSEKPSETKTHAHAR
mgnify:CR=1 FL=1